MDTPQVLLDHHLKTLRLPTFLREYDKVAQSPNCDQNLSTQRKDDFRGWTRDYPVVAGGA
jgi:hypothetical protein